MLYFEQTFDYALHDMIIMKYFTSSVKILYNKTLVAVIKNQ